MIVMVKLVLAAIVVGAGTLLFSEKRKLSVAAEALLFISGTTVGFFVFPASWMIVLLILYMAHRVIKPNQISSATAGNADTISDHK